jgi:signal transduction histidine kinase
MLRAICRPAGSRDLNLWADVESDTTGYGHAMAMLRDLQRDVRLHLWDYAVGGAMVVVAIVALTTRIDVQDADAFRFRSDTWWSWALTIGVCATLIGRRRWPLRTFVLAIALVLPLVLDRHRDSIAFFAIVIAFFSVATYSPHRLVWRAIATIAALYAVLILTGTMILRAASLVGPIFLATGFALGVMLRRDRTRQEHEVGAAIARGLAALETADLQAANERLRMAQELHDVVAHSLSVIAVQAGIGVHLIDRQPVEAGRALDAIRSVSHTTSEELTRLVGILRDGTATDDAYTPSIHDLKTLIDQTRNTGLPITFTVNGNLSNVPPGVSLAAYRIVQEALTNVVRHAGRAEVTVTANPTDEGINLCVDDNGHGITAGFDAENSNGGHGLIGMAERAHLYGGTVRSGPRPGGGFRVQATLPYFANPIANAVPNTITNMEIANPNSLSTEAKTSKPNHPLPSWMWDVLLAAFLAIITVLQIVADKPKIGGPQFTPTTLWAWSLRIGCCAMLALRRRHPTAMYASIWVLGLALAIGDYQVGVITFVLFIGMYSVGNYATTRRLIEALFGSFIGVAILAWSKPPDLTTAGAVWIGFLFAALAIAGYAVRTDRDRRTTDLTEREDAAHAQTRRARLVITTERLRIADELNSVISRSIQTIAHEAGTGSQMIETDPLAARRALEVISSISRDALNELRRLLKRIRTHSEPPVYSPIASSPGGSTSVTNAEETP